MNKNTITKTNLKTKTTTRNEYDIYHSSILTQKVSLLITEIDEKIEQKLQEKLQSTIEGKCIKEGFIKPNTIKILNCSSGNVNSEHIEFYATFECQITHPTQGMIIEDCEIQNITNAGIHAHKKDNDNVIPLTIFVAYDHNKKDYKYKKIIEEKTTFINIKVIGVRFELNDSYICVIGEIFLPTKKNGGETIII